MRQQGARAVHSVAVLQDYDFKPHKAVRLYFRADARALRVKRLAPPERIPAFLPAGCDHDPDTVDELAAKTALRITDASQLDEAMKTWTTLAEERWTQAMGPKHEVHYRAHRDRDKGAKASDSDPRGRSGGPQFVWVSPLADAVIPRRFTSPEALVWKAVADAVGDLAAGVVCSETARPAAEGIREAGRHAVVRLAKHAAPINSDGTAVTAARAWVGNMLKGPLSCQTFVLNSLHDANLQADMAKEELRRDRCCDWAEWMRGGAATGPGRQHRFTRIPSGWIPSRVGATMAPAQDMHDARWDDGEQQPAGSVRLVKVTAGAVATPLNSQEAVDTEADEWAEQWAEGDDRYPIQWPAAFGARMPDPTVALVMAAAFTIPEGTGLGWDNVHPRAIARLPVALVEALIRILLAAELLGQWPRPLALVVIALLAKDDGGFRPIGLFPAWIRLWTRIRRAQAQAWELDNSRTYLYAGNGERSRGSCLAAGPQSRGRGGGGGVLRAGLA